MIITWSPITQSWATWLLAISRQWPPTRVSRPSWVARWMVTYSRITVSSPIRTPTGTPSRYLRSCGAPPMMAPCPIRQRAPMATRPSSTAWAPISVDSPTRTSGPMMEYGPTPTPAASSALGSITAVGWMLIGSSLLLPFLGLVVVGVDDVVGEVDVGRGVEHRRTLALENERVTLLLAQLLDQPA